MMTEYNITDAVENYRFVIASAWPVISKMADKDPVGSFKDDWLQANWEMIVERSTPTELEVVLQFYGSGAECNKSSVRVWDPAAVATHRVLCVSKELNLVTLDLLTNKPMPKDIPLIFHSFVTTKYGGCLEEPPFDAVSIYTDIKHVIPVNGLEFVLQKIGSKGIVKLT